LLSQVRMGLGWEPAYRGKDIDLDASVIAYGPQRNHIDSCYFGKLQILHGAIQHSGDNLTGEGAGDDEVITVDLGRLPQEVSGLVFTVNSFSGQKFTEVAKAYCRLLDGTTGEELVRFDLTSAEAQTGVLMAKLIRQFSGARERTAMGPVVKPRGGPGRARPAAQARQPPGPRGHGRRPADAPAPVFPSPGRGPLRHGPPPGSGPDRSCPGWPFHARGRGAHARGRGARPSTRRPTYRRSWPPSPSASSEAAATPCTSRSTSTASTSGRSSPARRAAPTSSSAAPSSGSQQPGPPSGPPSGPLPTAGPRRARRPRIRIIPAPSSS